MVRLDQPLFFPNKRELNSTTLNIANLKKSAPCATRRYEIDPEVPTSAVAESYFSLDMLQIH